MVRVYSVLVVGVVAVFCEACTSTSGSDTFDTGDIPAVYPTYEPRGDTVDVGLNIRFRRGVEGRQIGVFDIIDVSRDGFIDVCEWTKEGGKTKNFVEFLTNDDNDGDEKISWQEFPGVKYID